jgi:hypothetical protein
MTDADDFERARLLAEMEENRRARWVPKPVNCPTCGEPSFYLPGTDLIHHLDGTAVCDIAPNVGVDIDAYDDVYLLIDQLDRLPQPEPLIDGVLDDHVLFSIVGPGDSFKSFLALAWLASLATGHDWLGRAVKQRRVLYVVGEGAYGLARRVAAWQTAWGVTIDPDWFHIRRVPVNLFKVGAAYTDLRARVTVEGYGVIVFDTLQRMTSGAERNSDKDAGLVIERLGELRAITDGTVGIVAHTGKNISFGTRGSSAWEDDLDTVWKVKPDDDTKDITIKLDKRKDGPEGLTLRLRPSIVPGTDSLVLEGTSKLEVREPAGWRDVLHVLTGRSIPDDGLAATPLREAVGKWDGNSQLYKVLDWLIAHGYVEKCPKGRYPTYKITVDGASLIQQTGGDLQ